MHIAVRLTNSDSEAYSFKAVGPSFSASCGNETPAASRSWAIGGRKGKRVKKEKSIRLGWANIRGDWEREVDREPAWKAERETIKEKPPLLPINKPAQHYCRSPQSLSTEGRGIRESSPSKLRQRIPHVCKGMHTGLCINMKKMLFACDKANYWYICSLRLICNLLLPIWN